MKKSFVYILLIIVISMFASVFSVSAADKPVTVGFAAASSGWPWYATFIQHVEDRCAKNGWESIILSADADVATQLNQVLDLIEKKVDYIIIGPLDAKASIPAIKKAHEANIPVIVIDDRDLGRNSAEIMAEVLKDSPSKKIFVVDGLAGQPAVTLRWEEMKPVFEKNGIEVVASEYADWDMVKAITVTEDMITRFPDIDAIFSMDGSMTPGIVQVLEESGMEDIPVVGLGGTATELELVKEGKVVGTACQSPGMNAEDAMDAIEALEAGETIEKRMTVNTPKTFAANADDCPGDW
jgi:ribose transport system substrate-binding protein